MRQTRTACGRAASRRSGSWPRRCSTARFWRTRWPPRSARARRRRRPSRRRWRPSTCPRRATSSGSKGGCARFSQRIEDVEDQIDRLSREVAAAQTQRLTLDFRLRVRARRPARPFRGVLAGSRRQRVSPASVSAAIRIAAAATSSARARARTRRSAGRRRRPRPATARRPVGVEVEAGDRRRPGAGAPSSSPRLAVRRGVGRDRLADARGRRRRPSRPRRSPARPAAARPSALAPRCRQVPIRTARRTPSSARSARTSAALGPPIPVAWIVSSPPRALRPE